MTAASHDSMAKLYENAMFDEWGNQPPNLRLQEKILIQTYCPDFQAEILNIGCGAGRETFGIHALGYGRVVGIDCTSAFIDLARQRALAQKSPVTFELGSADRMPFADGRFDAVTIFENVYGHITPRAARLEALREIRRVLKPTGVLMIEATSLADRYRYFAAIKVMELCRLLYNPHRLQKGDKLMRDARTILDLPPEQLPRSHWFRPREIDEESAEAGFRVELASTVAGVLRDPRHSSRRTHKQGRLIYVLKHS